MQMDTILSRKFISFEESSREWACDFIHLFIEEKGSPPFEVSYSNEIIFLSDVFSV